MRSFLFRKSWFLFTLLMFILSQSIVEHLHAGEKTDAERYSTFAVRTFIYCFSLGQMVVTHTGRFFKSYRKADTQTIKIFGWCPVPKYMDNWQECANFALMICLILMISFEPILHCMSNNHGVLFTDMCPNSKAYKFFPYSVVSMFAMFLYYALIIDLAVFNNSVSAYVLVCGRMIAEVALFILALIVIVVMFASAFSCLDQKEKEFHGIQSGSLALWEMVLDMWSGEHFDKLHNEPVVLFGCFAFLVFATVFLLNVLIAQLSCAYDAVYSDMVGYARLKRIRIIVESMPQVGAKRWDRFVSAMNFEKRIEFNEGDIGIANGVMTLEPASTNPTTIDMIKRFGGSTSPSIQWPEDTSTGDDDTEKFERLEILIKRAMERITKDGGKGGKSRGGGSSAGAGDSAQASSLDEGGSGDGGEEEAGEEEEE